MTERSQGRGRRPDGAAFVIAAMLAALGALLLWDAGQMLERGGYSGVGPDGMPRVIGYSLLGLAVWTGLSGLGGAAPREHHEVAPVIWIVGGLLAQMALLKLPDETWGSWFGLALPGFPWWFPQGFSVASGLLFAFTAAAFGKRRLLVTVPVGIALALAVYGVFDQVLKLNLPAGPVERLIFGG